MAPRSVALGLALIALAGPAFAATAPLASPVVSEPPQAKFGEQIDVGLVTLVVRVVDGTGAAVRGLAATDFRAWVGNREVPVTAADWTGAEETSPEQASFPAVQVPSGEPASGGASPEAWAPGGALVVLFVEADNNEPGRTRGHLRTLGFAQDLLGSLASEDRVAVVSFGSHLKVWRDFSRDRAAVPEALFQAIRFGGEPPPSADAGPLSLARHLDPRLALAAASPERALELVADALAPLPGEKSLVFIGWGLGDFSTFGTKMTPAFAPAVHALKAARTTVFALDVTEADSHDLELGLRSVAEETGGTFEKTNLFPNLALQHLARTLSGYYTLTLDPGSLPRRGGWARVELRDKPGSVLLRPHRIPPRPEP